ncbi:alpha/beta fold hydrolase [Oscillatoria salina]|uniref:alpha/beta fold hydrolase n=1 Tax=Oscillatoria salina TaxID=331517 RepID=UPI0013BA7F24|nr:alpha/beta hydrolase [Oscillatoria salina]MBZ8181853.1 alpha/beta hydrolase [Oscillatoria salina IIICB1]NET90585.1 alpha/beta hydrolase [Kamptonema sp. SIO1D9]
MQDWWQKQFPQGRQYLKITDARGNPVQIAYGEKGRGKPLIFVHGLGIWSISWQHNIDFFAQYYRVICFDLKGYGFSDKPAYPDKSGYKIIELERILAALEIKAAAVVTESVWGAVGLAVAEEKPELIDRLIVIGGTIFPKKLPNIGLKIMAVIPLSLVRIIDILRLPKILAPLTRWNLRQIRSEVVVRGEIPPEDVYWQAYPYINFLHASTRLVIDVKQAAAEISCLQQQKPCLLSKIQDKLETITCPTLVLWGAKDRWFPVTEARKLDDRLPNSRLKIIPDCGHDVSADCPDEMNQILLEFLQDTDY